MIYKNSPHATAVNWLELFGYRALVKAVVLISFVSASTYQIPGAQAASPADSFDKLDYRPCGSFQNESSYPPECKIVLENLNFTKKYAADFKVEVKTAPVLDYWCTPQTAEGLNLLKEASEIQKSDNPENPKLIQNLRTLYFNNIIIPSFQTTGRGMKEVCSIYYRDQYAQKLFYPWPISGAFHPLLPRKSIYVNEMTILSKMASDTKDEQTLAAITTLIRSVQTEWLIHFANVAYVEKSKETFKHLLPGIAGVFALSGVMLMGKATFDIGFKIPRLGTLLSQFAYESGKGLSPIGDNGSEPFDHGFPEPSSYFKNTNLLAAEKDADSVANVHSDLLKAEIEGVMAGYATGFLSQIVLETGPIGHAVHSITGNLVEGVLGKLRLGLSETSLASAGEAVASFHVLPTILSLIVAEEGVHAFKEFEREKMLRDAISNWQLKATLLRDKTKDLLEASNSPDAKWGQKQLELYNLALSLYNDTAASAGIILFPAFDKMVELRDSVFNIQGIPIRAQCIENCLGRGKAYCTPATTNGKGDIVTAIPANDRVRFARDFKPFEHRINAALNLTSTYREIINTLFEKSVGLKSFFIKKIELFEKSFIMTNGSLLPQNLSGHGDQNPDIAFDYVNVLETEVRSKAKLILEKTHGGITRMPQARELCAPLVVYK